MRCYRYAKAGMTALVLLGVLLSSGVALAKPKLDEIMAKKEKGASKLDDLKRDGDYYIVTGADIHNLCGELLDKKVRFRGKVDKTQGQMWGLAKPLIRIVAEDGEFYMWVSQNAKVPEDFKTAIQKGGLQKPEVVEIWCTLSELPSMTGMTAYTDLPKRSGVTGNVDKWGR